MFSILVSNSLVRLSINSWTSLSFIDSLLLGWFRFQPTASERSSIVGALRPDAVGRRAGRDQRLRAAGRETYRPRSFEPPRATGADEARERKDPVVASEEPRASFSLRERLDGRTRSREHKRASI